MPDIQTDDLIMIVEAVWACEFGRTRLHRGLPGWRRVLETDAAVARYAAVAEASGHFEVAIAQLLAVVVA